MSPRIQSIFYAFIMLVLITFALVGFIFMGFLHPLPWVCVGLILLCTYINQKLVDQKRIKWDDSLAIGFKSLDDEHKQLISLLDRFYTAAVYEKGEAFEAEALKELVAYTHDHFDREEQEMIASNYPQYEEHKRQHVEMREKIDELSKHYDSSSAEEVAELLLNWLNNHIKIKDAELGRYLVYRQKRAGSGDQVSASG